MKSYGEHFEKSHPMWMDVLNQTGQTFFSNSPLLEGDLGSWLWVLVLVVLASSLSAFLVTHHLMGRHRRRDPGPGHGLRARARGVEPVRRAAVRSFRSSGAAAVAAAAFYTHAGQRPRLSFLRVTSSSPLCPRGAPVQLALLLIGAPRLLRTLESCGSLSPRRPPAGCMLPSLSCSPFARLYIRVCCTSHAR